MKYQKVIETNKELMPKGERSGDISYDHRRLEQLDDLRSIKEIAYLFQNPSAQMAMHPKVLILDEPTAQLDSTVRNDFLVMLQKLHKEFGKIKYKKKAVYMPQDQTLLFVKDQLFADLLEMGKGKEERVDELLEMADLMKEKYAHPYDLSGGQQQMVALVKVLLAAPEILLLDEPTKGMDREHSRRFGELLQKLADEGRTIFMVSHDLEFCAEYADRIGKMFDDKIEGIGEPSELQFTL